MLLLNRRLRAMTVFPKHRNPLGKDWTCRKMTSVKGLQRKLAYSRRVTAAFSMEINEIHSKAVLTGLLDQIRKRLSSLGKRTGSASNRKEWVTNMLWWKIIILASWRIVVYRTYWKWHFIQKLRSSNFNSFFHSKSQALYMRSLLCLI